MLLLAACIDTGVVALDKDVAGLDTGDPIVDPTDDTATDTTHETAEDTGTIIVPPPEELCNGLDDDGDGLIDEDFGDADADGTADCLDVEECDGLDNDGDTEVDEGFDADSDTIVDCFEVDYDVALHVTADDAFEGYFDGVSVVTDTNWYDAHDAVAVMDSGPHVVAIHAWDLYGPPSGLLAAIEVDGAIWSLSGDADWVYTRTEPDPTWADVGFDDSAWSAPDVCDPSPWGSQPTDLAATGAAWLWEGDCRTVGEGWFRVEMWLP